MSCLKVGRAPVKLQMLMASDNRFRCNTVVILRIQLWYNLYVSSHKKSYCPGDVLGSRNDNPKTWIGQKYKFSKGKITKKPYLFDSFWASNILSFLCLLWAGLKLLHEKVLSSSAPIIITSVFLALIVCLNSTLGM